MTIIYRTDDSLKWGTGKGSDLDPEEVDNNFWELFTDFMSITDHLAELVVSIDYITVSANTFTVTLTDHTVLGPFTLPQINWNWRGTWAPATNYAVYDVITINAQVYQVLITHQSDSSFDPNATNGSAQLLYGLLFEVPGNVLPGNGHTGQILMKASDDDFDLKWWVLYLDDLQDVFFTSPLENGEVLTYFNGSWQNRAVSPGVPAVQTQGGNWTPTLDDANTYNRFTGSSTMTIPLNSTVAFAVGTEIHGRQAAGGVVTITAESGVTLNLQDNCLAQTSGQGATFTVKKVAANEWDLFGRLEPSGSP